MLTEEDYCDYDTCVALEELGFSSTNNECFQSKIISKEVSSKFFDTKIQVTSLEYAPIISLYEAQKWLREEKHLYVEVTIVVSGKNYMFEIYDTEIATLKRFIEEDFNSYEEALLEGVRASIKILQDEQKENN